MEEDANETATRYHRAGFRVASRPSTDSRRDPRHTRFASIARGRRWLDEIVAGTVTGVEQIAARDKCSIRQVNMTISLAFLAPDLVKAASSAISLPWGSTALFAAILPTPALSKSSCLMARRG